ncbi:hypothetical protein ROJ8625_03351 [Roseivivax jejudonensis]|uniref:Uncharacterized protein n=1 Tax=Roseivivax jejudonensis TaxID=1529041 RepID=A0A1X7A131_9RHOB|nr:hypothetical protein [Roseivivax jejudonensis]SLN65572.1 hypothetical protein ROJ8625_03351 [Roseivivax jejudonensis]
MAEARRIRPARTATVAVAAVAIIALLAILAPAAMAGGLLVAWVTALSATTGAGVWLLIARLTGGVWPEAGGTTLPALARATPLVAPFGVLVFLAGPLLYPWWQGAEGLRGEIYLVPWSFALRGAAILALWSLIGWLAPRRPAPVPAALLLTGYGITVGVAGLDWILSRDPAMLSTTFGMLLAAMQLGIALAFCAALGLDTRRARAVADWGGLLLACCLGAFYLAAMQFLVSWSGNLPFKAAWYGARADGLGTALIALTVILGVLVPFAALIRTDRRGSDATLRQVGTVVLAAAVLHILWLAVPEAPLPALLGAAAILTLLALAALTWSGRDG